MEALEYHTVKAMADPVELCSVVWIELLWGEFRAFELRKVFQVRLLYRFHMYYHMKRVLKRLQVPLPYESRFNAADNLYSSGGFFKLCQDYGLPHNPLRYQNEKFFGTHQHEGWSDYIDPDSMTSRTL